MKRIIRRILPLWLLFPAGLPAAADWQSLLGNSPFGGMADTAPAAPAAGELEFRGVVQEEDLVLVNLFNPATKTSAWVPVNGSAADIRVQSYNPGSSQVSVSHAGRQVTLPLKQAKVALVAIPVAQPAGAEQPRVENQAQGSEAERLAQIAEEIRRRRAMRQPGGGAGAEFFNSLPPEARAAIEEIRRARSAAMEENAAAPGSDARPARGDRGGFRPRGQ
jgi:hypothetical protein